MATFSKKMMGKEVGDASVYAKPHSNPVLAGRPVPAGEKTKATRVAGPQPSTTAEMPNQRPNRSKLDTYDVSVGAISKSAGDEPVKTSGIKVRGTGAATKGLMARGPMA
jgi:hypothetical protein